MEDEESIIIDDEDEENIIEEIYDVPSQIQIQVNQKVHSFLLSFY